MPAGYQYWNGLVEIRVKAIKSTLDHMLMITLIVNRPTLTYTDLCTLLARASSINNRPISFCQMTEEETVPLTVNQLLLGRSTTTICPTDEESPDFSILTSPGHDSLLYAL